MKDHKHNNYSVAQNMWLISSPGRHRYISFANNQQRRWLELPVSINHNKLLQITLIEQRPSIKHCL